MGEVEKWDDPEILALNNRISSELPHSDIHVYISCSEDKIQTRLLSSSSYVDGDLFALEAEFCQGNFSSSPAWSSDSSRLHLRGESATSAASGMTLDPFGVVITIYSFAKEKDLPVTQFYTKPRSSVLDIISSPESDAVSVSQSSMSACTSALYSGDSTPGACWPLTYLVKWIQRKHHTGQSCDYAYSSLLLLDALKE